MKIRVKLCESRVYIFNQTRKSNVQNPSLFVFFPYKNVLFPYFSVIFQYVFTHFFPKLARLCELNRQYQPKNEHSPQNPPKISTHIPQILKKIPQKPFTPSGLKQSCAIQQERHGGLG